MSDGATEADREWKEEQKATWEKVVEAAIKEMEEDRRRKEAKALPETNLSELLTAQGNWIRGAGADAVLANRIRWEKKMQMEAIKQERRRRTELAAEFITPITQTHFNEEGMKEMEEKLEKKILEQTYGAGAMGGKSSDMFMEELASGAGTAAAGGAEPGTGTPAPQPTIPQALNSMIFRFDGKVHIEDPFTGEIWQLKFMEDPEKVLPEERSTYLYHAPTVIFAIMASMFQQKPLDIGALPAWNKLVEAGFARKLNKWELEAKGLAK